ncbi:MAG: glycine cleavage system aminomethyltransferase GcvT [Catenulispora sp.]|nr:glycine cleavage system aminomethyltransferase GcvT [Catenulispora sp.]
MTTDLLTSPLHARHVALGAKMADFGGWDMPIEYSAGSNSAPGAGGGVLKEHAAVRSGVGVFDVSHLGKAAVTGPGAAAFVNSVLANDLARIEEGQAQYTLCCDEATGGVVDDLIAYLYGADDVFLIPNAANTAEVVRRLQAAAPEGVTVENQHQRFGVLAVQGPKSAEVLAKLGLPTEHDYMSFVVADFQGAPVIVCRTGYTGEHGYELVPLWDKTEALWDALLEAGEEYEIRACGLGARDTLRTEMGYPLHGQDLSLEITPNMARAGWAVGWKKPAFWGRDALLAEREAGAKRLLRGIKAVDRAIPRSHMVVNDAAGKQIGEVTSGTFSPTLREGIGLALLDRDYTEGDTVYLDVRGKAAAFTVVKPPFVDVRTRN